MSDIDDLPSDEAAPQAASPPPPPPPKPRKVAPVVDPQADRKRDAAPDEPAQGWRRWVNLQWISALIIGSWLLPSMCTTYVQPDEIGVRRSLNSGVEDDDFEQGHHLGLPLLHSWYRLRRTVHYVEFTGTNTLDLRTRENNVVHVDIAVIYRILPGEAHLIVREGFADSYHAKVQAVSEGFLREHLAQLSNETVQIPSEREKVAKSAIVPLNKQLRQYHVNVVTSGVVIRAIQFDPPYEAQLQAKQLFAVQAELDTAKQQESKAKQETDTVQKGIDKDVALERETWNKQIEEKRKEIEITIAEVKAKAVEFDKTRRSEADAEYEKLLAQGERAEAEAEALGKKLEAEALASRAGRTFSAIEATRNFKLGAIELNSSDPRFLHEFGSMAAWRRFFLGE
jgi:regulator of protease activity HflC (stomatin/prohibitin superfamily)